MDAVVLVADVAWVKRGVAKKIPDKVELDSEQIKNLIQGGNAETSDQDSEDEPTKLRGSASNLAEEVDEETAMKEYMKEYEDQTEEKAEKKEGSGLGMRGIAMFSSPVDDPHMTKHTDSDEEEEKEDLVVKDDDNFVISAKVDRGAYTIEVHVFNQSAGDWYVHHDYILESPPLCLETFSYDPGSENHRGNLLAVGTISGTIEVWDLDIVNSCEPSLVLGGKLKGKRKKRDGQAQGHSDAVLSIKWNSLTPHVMASGDAEGRLLLWDIDDTKVASVINAAAEGGIQSLQWHPAEEAIILTGSMGGVLAARDCRTEQSQATWSVEGVQIEKVIWDSYSPFNAIFAADDGFIRYVDMRKTGEVMYCVAGHTGAIEGLSLSAGIRGMAATAGSDGDVKVWNISASGVVPVHSASLSIGSIHSLSFSPNSPSILAVGGEKNELTKVIDVMDWSQVASHFTSLLYEPSAGIY